MRYIHIYMILLFSCFALSASAAPKEKKIKVETPDMKKIEEEVNNPKSKYFYPKLLQKYERNDTLMQHDEYRHLYYGYIFQEDYNPYRRSEFSDKIESLYYKTKHSRAECDTIIKYAELSLKDNPFDLQQMNFLIYALREKKKIHLANIWQYRLNHLLEAIVSSGTGLDQENAWYVVIPKNEYTLINSLGYIADSQEFVNPYFDYITIQKKKDKDPVGFYFNVKNILEEYYRKYPDEE